MTLSLLVSTFLFITLARANHDLSGPAAINLGSANNTGSTTSNSSTSTGGKTGAGSMNRPAGAVLFGLVAGAVALVL